MYQGQIYPQFVYDPIFDITIALMAFFGGFGTLLGPILGGLILESTSSTSRSRSPRLARLAVPDHLRGAVPPRHPVRAKGIVIYVRDWWTRRAVKAELATAAPRPSRAATDGNASQRSGRFSRLRRVQALNGCSLNVEKGSITASSVRTARARPRCSTSSLAT